MKCLICEGDTNVINSRLTKDGVTRRRECTSCLTRFSTHEIIVLASLDAFLREKYVARLGDCENVTSH